MDQVVLALLEGVFALTWKHFVMYAAGGVLIYLAIKKEYEPMLLLPIGFGAILVNLPLETVWVFDGEPGILQLLFNAGIVTELFPILIFVAIGAMIDFTPLFKMPIMIFFGAAAQFGIFATICAVIFIAPLMAHIDPRIAAMTPEALLKFAASVGIIGSADGPTSIYVATRFAREYLGPISVAAYSYMSLVPIIQPPIIKLLTTKKERRIKMVYHEAEASKLLKILFPIMISILAGIIAPISVPLIGLLMFGNLIRECGVLEKLSLSAQNELASLVTLLLGITIGSTMRAEAFLTPVTIMILFMGLVAFVFDTAGGVLFAKFINLFLKNKINPMIGAAGISAFPMSARVVHKIAMEEDFQTVILMQAISANASGQLGSVMAGGVVLALVPVLINLFL